MIVGTAHVSPRSIEEVKEIIEKERPDAVAVELCPRRFKTLVEGYRENISHLDVLKKGDVFLLLFQIILSHLQKKIGEEYGVRPGQEMLTAIEKAREIGADVILIDRDIAVTFKRFWTSLGFLEKIKFISYLIRTSSNDVEIDEMLKQDILDSLIREFRKISPKAANVLIDERDLYMAANLLNVMKKYNKVVAVVGAGHKKGIETALEKAVKEGIDIRKLSEVKEGKNILKLASYFIAILILSLFVGIAVSLSTEALLEAFMYWFLINGILAALGAAVGGGHILSILAAFFTAWLTSLNPLMAAGWISGAVEAWIRKPTSADLAQLFEARSLREMMKNKFFRVLLVAALTNVGSAIGTIYGGYYITAHFGIDIARVISEKIQGLL